MVRLERVDENNYKECFKLQVTEEQYKFVKTTASSLATAYVYHDIVTPFVIYNDEAMVGFMMLRFDEEYSSYFLWQFMIDEKYQYKGYGKKSLKLAIEWAKKDKRCNAMVTTYILGNDIAKNLYIKAGFEPMGEPIDGEADMILKF